MTHDSLKCQGKNGMGAGNESCWLLLLVDIDGVCLLLGTVVSTGQTAFLRWGQNLLMIRPTGPTPNLRLLNISQCTFSLYLTDECFFYIKRLVELKESFLSMYTTYTWFCVGSLLRIFVEVLITPDSTPDIRSIRSNPPEALGTSVARMAGLGWLGMATSFLSPTYLTGRPIVHNW